VTFDRFAWHRQFRGVKMPPAAARAAMALFDRANQTGQCWPGIATLAADTGLTDTGVRNGIDWLESNGFVEKLVRGGRSGDGKSRSTRYRLKFATISTATPVAVEGNLNRHETTSQPQRNDVSTATPVAPNRPENRTENRTEPPYPPQPQTSPPDPRTDERGKALAKIRQANLTARSPEAYRIAQAFSDSQPVPIESGLLAEISAEVAKCLRANIPPTAIAAGLQAWTHSDRLYPSQIPRFVHKANNGQPVATSDQRVAQAQALKAKFANIRLELE
jgi:hypothetical protein